MKKEKANLTLTKLGFFLKAFLNLFLFGLFIFFLDSEYFFFLGFESGQIGFLKFISVIAIFLGSFYFWGVLNYEKQKIISKITYIDALFYPVVILIAGMLVDLPWSVWLSSSLVGISSLLLIEAKSYYIIF